MAQSRFQDPTADGVISVVYGRLRRERSFPPADGDGLCWSLAAPRTARPTNDRLPHVPAPNRPFRSPPVLSADLLLWRENRGNLAAPAPLRLLAERKPR